MKKVNKMLMVVALAAITMLSSCIKNEVAPEVQALRQAQLAMITAKIELQNLLNEQQRIQNSLDSMQLVVDIQEAQLDLQIAIDELQAYLDGKGFAQAAEYLGNYNATMNGGNIYLNGDYQGNINPGAFTVLTNIAVKEKDIATTQLLLNGTVPWSIVLAEYARDLTQLNSKLTIEQAALAVLEAIQADPNSRENEIETLRADVDALESQNAELKAQKDGLTNDKNDATNAFEEAEDMITIMDGGVFNSAQSVNDFTWAALAPYEGLTQELANENNNLVGKQEAIDNAQANITTAEAELTVLEGLLASYTATLNAAQSILDTKTSALASAQAAYDQADAAYQIAVNNEAAALENLNTAQANLALDPADPDLIAAEAAAQTAYTNAQAATATALSARDDANQELAIATNEKNGAQTNYNTANADVMTAQTNVDNKETAIGGFDGTGDPNDVANWTGLYAVKLTAEQALATTNEKIADATAAIAAHQSDYNNAVTNIAALETAMDAAIDAEQAVTDQITDNTTAIGRLNSLITIIDDEFFADADPGILEPVITDLITAQEDVIETLQNDIAAKQTQIDQGNIDVQKLNDDVARMQEELADLNVEYNALLAQAAEWLALMNAELGG